jgi:outer membrane protein TolC
MLTAETGTAYVELRALQQQIDNVERNIEIQKHSAKIAWALFEKGKTSKLDAVQAEAALMSSQAELPQLYASLRVEVNRLAVLVGMPPGELDDMLLAKQPIPTSPSQVAKVIPAELLRRRSDIRLAERKVAGETALIGAAVADLYPQFSISGTFGLDARQFSTFFKYDSINTGIGPSTQ